MIRGLLPPAVLDTAIGLPGRRRLDALCATVAAEPARLDRVFPAAAREVGRAVVQDGPRQVPVPDAVRVQLLAAAEETAGPDLLHEVRELYRFGDAEEKRAVLHGLNQWDDERVDAHDVLEDALRTNDTRLLAVAMGAHARRLDQPLWRHGVLKCLFTGVPLAVVADLEARADRELADMASRYARERSAAGRDVPADVASLARPDLHTVPDDQREA